MPQKILELCEKAASLNYLEKHRTGNVINLPENGRLVVSGDLHGHKRNLQRLKSFADLENNPESHLVLQEIIHGGPEDDFGGCLSYNTLFEALRLKVQFPEQVHFVLGNHDTAMICDNTVMKAGKEMNQAMKSALLRQYEEYYDDIICAIKQYLLSQPLAIRCANRIWISHSLPANRFANDFDPEVLGRKLLTSDMQRPKSAYLLTWGRRHSQKTLNKFAEMFDVDIFILGHQQQEAGWAKAGDNLIILATDHNHGCVVDLDLSKTYEINEVAAQIKPIAAIQ